MSDEQGKEMGGDFLTSAVEVLLREVVHAFALDKNETSSASHRPDAFSSREEAQLSCASAAAVLYANVAHDEPWLANAQQLQTAALFVQTFLHSALSITAKIPRSMRRAFLKPCLVIPLKIGVGHCRALLPGVASQCVRYLVHPAAEDGEAALAVLHDTATVLARFIEGIEAHPIATEPCDAAADGDMWARHAAPKLQMCFSVLSTSPQQATKRNLTYLSPLCAALRRSSLSRADENLARDAVFLSAVIAHGDLEEEEGCSEASLRADISHHFARIREEVIRARGFFCCNGAASLLAVASPSEMASMSGVFEHVMRNALRTMQSSWTEKEYICSDPAGGEIARSIEVLSRWPAVKEHLVNLLEDWDAYVFHPGAVYLLLRSCVSAKTLDQRQDDLEGLVSSGKFDDLWAAVSQEHLWHIELDADELTFQQIQHRALVAGTIVSGLAEIVACLGRKRRTLRRFLLLTLYDVMEKCCDSQSIVRDNALAFVASVQRATKCESMSSALMDYMDNLLDDASRAVLVVDLTDAAVNVVRGCLGVFELDGGAGCRRVLTKIKVALAIAQSAFQESPRNALKLVSLCANVTIVAEKQVQREASFSASANVEPTCDDDDENPSPASSRDPDVHQAQMELYAMLLHLERSMSTIPANERRCTIDAAVSIFHALIGDELGQARQPLLPAMHIWYGCLVDTALAPTGMRLCDVQGFLSSTPKVERNVLQRMSSNIDIPAVMRALRALLLHAKRFLSHRYVHELLPLVLLWCKKARHSTFARDQDVFPPAAELIRTMHAICEVDEESKTTLSTTILAARLSPADSSTLVS